MRESRDLPAPQNLTSLPGWGSTQGQAPGPPRSLKHSCPRPSCQREDWGGGGGVCRAAAPGVQGWGPAPLQSCLRSSNDGSCQSRPWLSPPCVSSGTTPIKDELSVSLVPEPSGFQLGAS